MLFNLQNLAIFIVLFSGLVILFLPNVEIVKVLMLIARPTSEYEHQFFEENVVNRISSIKYVTTSLLIVLSLLLYKGRGLINNYLSLSWEEINKLFKIELSSVSKSIIAISSLIYVLLCYSQQIHFDEAYSLVYYINKGPLVTLSLYNSTNNHLLINFLASLIGLVRSELFFLRLLSVIFSILTLILGAKFCTQFFKKGGYLFLLFLSVSIPFIYYSCHIRGYIAILLFTLLSSASAILLCSERSKSKIQELVFVFASILGFFSLPTYILTFLSQLLFLVYNRYDVFKIIKMSILVVLGTCICYAPVMLISGPSMLTSNPQIERLITDMTINEYIDHISVTGHFVFGSPIIFILASILAFYILMTKENDQGTKLISQLWIAGVAVSLVLPLLVGSMIPPRVYIFLIIFNALLFVAAFKNSRKMSIVTIGVLTYFNINSIDLHTFSNEIVTTLNNEVEDVVDDSTEDTHIFINHHSLLRVLFLYQTQNLSNFKITGNLISDRFECAKVKNSTIIYSASEISCEGYSKEKQQQVMFFKYKKLQ